MAEFSKKFNMTNLEEFTESCKIYSTLKEAGDNFINAKINNIQGYIPIGNKESLNASKGRILKNDIECRILTRNNVPEYTEISYTIPGTYIFTVPENVNKIKYLVIGGGSGGGAATFSGYYDDELGWTNLGPTSVTSGAGGQSSISALVVARGGIAAYAYCNYYKMSDGEGYYWYQYDQRGTPGAQPGGNRNGSSYGAQGGQISIAGGIGYSLNFNNSNGTVGQGGNVIVYGPATLASGGTGEIKTGELPTIGGEVYTIKVGSGGVASYNSGVGYAGSPGGVLIAYGRGVE